MGNENQVTDLTTQSSARFLPEEIKDLDAIADVYNLETEFAKSKKNKNLFLYVFILAFILIVGGSTYLFTTYIEQKSRDFDINISEFEDLRLKEVIGSARSHENNLDLQKIRLEVLMIEQQEAILVQKKRFFQQEMMLLAKDLPLAETNRRIAQTRAMEKKKIAVIVALFREKIKKKEGEIAEIEKNVADKKNKTEEKKSAAISNIDKLNALKMKIMRKKHDSGIVILREYYENYIAYLTLRFNPFFGSKRIKAIMAVKDDGGFDRSTYLRTHNPMLLQEGVSSIEGFDKMRRKIEDYFYLLDRIRRIPFQNSVMPALNRVKSLTGSIIQDYENLQVGFIAALGRKDQVIAGRDEVIAGRDEIIAGRDEIIAGRDEIIARKDEMIRKKEQEIRQVAARKDQMIDQITARKDQVIRSKNRMIENYTQAFDYLLKEKIEGGYIVEPSNLKNILIYVNNAYRIKPNSTALVFRDDDEYIGRIRFTRIGNVIRAKVVEIAQNKKIKPFDKIILQIN